MKTVFITIGETLAVRNILQTDFWAEFKKNNPNFRVVFVCDFKKRDYYRKIFEDDNVVVEGISVKKSFFEKFVYFLGRNGFYNKSNMLEHWKAYLQKQTFIPPLFKKIFGLGVHRFKLFRRILRFLELSIKPKRQMAILFEKYEPVLLFSTVMINSDVDTPILREAIRRKVHTVGMMRSWDNLTVGVVGFLRLIPDVFLAQNEFLKEMAVLIHDVPPERITVIGIPHYDFYLRGDFIGTREAFFHKMGLDLNKRLIIYGAVGRSFYHESEMAEVFEDMIHENKIDYPIQVLFRGHPAFRYPLPDKKFKHVIFDSGEKYFKKELGDWEMNFEDMRHLINSIYHSDIMITAGSTMMIDGAVLDKPVITVGFDGKNGEDVYWLKVARFYDRLFHIMQVIKTGGVRIVWSKDELAEAVNQYLENPSLDKEGRTKIIERFVAPFDGKSGKRLAEILTKELI